MITVPDVIRWANASGGSERLEGFPQWIQNAQNGVFEHIKMRTNYYRFLRRLVETLRPEVVIELGVEFGIASAMMASVHIGDYQPEVFGIDVNWHNIPGEIIYNMCPNYHYIIGDTTDKENTFDVVVKMMNEHPKLNSVGLVFQDSSHHYQASKTEWELYSQLMDKGNSLWVCDDITPAFHDPKIDPPGKGMMQYFQELPGNKIAFSNLHKGNTIGVVLV